MKRRIITTGDGSKTIQIEDWNEQYHSIHGALQEARHVFIKHGLQHFISTQHKTPSKDRISILEIGFGTGLNALLTLEEAGLLQVKINYTGVEAYPVSNQELSDLNYSELISNNSALLFHRLHATKWEQWSEIDSNFKLLKQKKYFQDIDDHNLYQIIYFDAFGARVQPDLWTEDIFNKMYNALQPGGLLVTYSAKGSVRRAMEAVGFSIERLPGPPGKREMLRALKLQ